MINQLNRKHPVVEDSKINKENVVHNQGVKATLSEKVQALAACGYKL